ncbi:hypothetical protein V7D15_06980 [Thermoanaerobacter thermohydrosulfuricus]
MSKKKSRKIQPGDFVTFVVPKKVDPAVIDYLNDTSKTRNKKIIEAIEFYINKENMYETILKDLKEELLKEIKNIIEKNLSEEKTGTDKKVEKDENKIIDDFIYNVFNKMKSLRE